MQRHEIIDQNDIPIRLTPRELARYAVVGMHVSGDFKIPEDGTWAEVVPDLEGGHVDGARATSYTLYTVDKDKKL